MSSDPPAWSTPPEVAALLRVRGDKPLHWIATGELVAVNLAENPNGRPRWKISAEALADFLKRRQSQPPPKVTRQRKRKARKSYFADVT